MDNVICLICGMAPKSIVSDGNSKVTRYYFEDQLVAECPKNCAYFGRSS